MDRRSGRLDHFCSGAAPEVLRESIGNKQRTQASSKTCQRQRRPATPNKPVKKRVANCMVPEDQENQKTESFPENHPVETEATRARVPAEIHGQRYISLATFRKSGAAVYTPIWFAEDNNRIYCMTSSKTGKCKRIRSNPRVKIAPCSIRGKITGPEFRATALILSPAEFPRVRQAIKAKYWLARLPFLWRNTDTCIEITPA